MSNYLLTYRNVLLFYATWWTLWIVLQAGVLCSMHIELRVAAVDAFISNVVLAISGYMLGNILRFYQPGNKNVSQLFIWSFVMAILAVLFIQCLLRLIFKDEIYYLNFLNDFAFVRFCFSFLMMSCINLLNWLWFHFRGLKESEKRKSDAEKLLREAELSNLRQQLQPHFLFNSLNSISALAGSRPEEARKMIQQLSDFLRGTIRKDEQQLVKLKDELDHLELYLEIEKVRFGNRLQTRMEIAEGLDEMKLPSLLLQPVIENAIKFGLYDTLGQVTIEINAALNNGYLLISVKNPFDPSSATRRHGEGFGLSSVKRRLYLLYARNDLLETSIDENIFTTTLKIPPSA